MESRGTHEPTEDRRLCLNNTFQNKCLQNDVQSARKWKIEECKKDRIIQWSAGWRWEVWLWSESSGLAGLNTCSIIFLLWITVMLDFILSDIGSCSLNWSTERSWWVRGHQWEQRSSFNCWRKLSRVCQACCRVNTESSLKVSWSGESWSMQALEVSAGGQAVIAIKCQLNCNWSK